MIEQVSYSTPLSTGNIRLVAGTLIKPVPPAGTIVNVNVLDKVGSEYKILVDGSLFRSKLPFTASGGDDFIAKIIKSDPFTLSVDNFAQIANVKSSNLGAILSMLNLEDTAKIRTMLKKIISEGKPLLKSKIKALIEFFENYEINEMQLAAVINLIWMNELDSRRRQMKELQKIFSISFDELCSEIFNIVLKLNTMNLSEGFYAWINKIMCVNIANPSAVPHLLPLKDKSHSILSFIKYMNVLLDDAMISAIQKEEIKKLKERLIQYVLQKALLAGSNYYPEFALIKKENSLELVLFNYEKVGNNNSGNTYRLIISDSEDDSKLNVIYANDNIYGELNCCADSSGSCGKIMRGFIDKVSSGLDMKVIINISPVRKMAEKQLKKINNRL